MNVGLVEVHVLNLSWPYRQLAPMTQAARRLYRSGTIVAGPAHDDYTHDGSPLREAGAVNLTGVLAIAHDNRSRPDQREQAARTYRALRRDRGLELA